MSQDIKRDREIGKVSVDVVHLVQNAIYPHLDVTADQNSWHIARAAIAAYPVGSESERWQDIAYNENERAGKLSDALVAKNAELTDKAQRIAELEQKVANGYADAAHEETVARIRGYILTIERDATADEAAAHRNRSGDVSLHDDLLSRFTAATRARIARKTAKALREIVGDEGVAEYPKYWNTGHLGITYRVIGPASKPEVYMNGWHQSELFFAEKDLDEHRESRAITAADLTEGVEP